MHQRPRNKLMTFLNLSFPGLIRPKPGVGMHPPCGGITHMKGPTEGNEKNKMETDFWKICHWLHYRINTVWRVCLEKDGKTQVRGCQEGQWRTGPAIKVKEKNNDNSNTNNNININIINNSNNTDNKKIKLKMVKKSKQNEKLSVSLHLWYKNGHPWAAFDPQLGNTTEIVNNFFYCFCLVETRSFYWIYESLFHCQIFFVSFFGIFFL